MQARAICQRIVDELQKDGYHKAVTEVVLRKEIMNVRNCIDERAINRWIQALLVFGLMEVKAPHVYQIKNGKNTETAPMP